MADEEAMVNACISLVFVLWAYMHPEIQKAILFEKGSLRQSTHLDTFDTTRLSVHNKSSRTKIHSLVSLSCRVDPSGIWALFCDIAFSCYDSCTVKLSSGPVFVLVTAFVNGGMAQWLGRRSLTGGLSLTGTRSMVGR